ncbi:MAG: DUF885 domain-containing protein [Gammaproteobacteria bacterium]|nr:DUF885 domain-containing protein [Gammaproteobacteria bacterium]
MLRHLACVLVALCVCSCGGSGSSAPPTTAPPPPAGLTDSQLLAQDLQGLPLTDFYSDSFAAITYRSPENIIWNALTSVYPLGDVGLDNLSDQYQRETFAIFQVILDGLHSYDRSALSSADQLTYDFYEWYLQDAIDGLDFFYYDFVATYNFFGVQSQTERFFTDIHPMATRQDAEDYVTRLNDVLQKFRSVVDYLSNASASGVIEPRLTLDVASFYLGDIADGSVATNPYYTAFVAKLDAIPGLTQTQRTSLADSARAAVTGSVIPAYQELRQRLSSLSASAPASIGVGQYPLGREYYNYKLRHHTTTDLSAAEIHQLGIDELARVHAEMRVIFDQLGYPQNETLQQLFARVTVDGGTIPAANVKATYEAIIDAAEQELDQAFDIFPAADVIVAEDPSGGFYIGPSFDGTRPGAFYAGTQSAQPWFLMPSLTYHEAVPGHHTQIALAMEQQGEAFRRAVRFTSFAEGWALYAERLAFELGWYDGDPYGNLGRLQYEALRAARLVIDTGIHSLGWSFEEAVQFNMEALGTSRGASEGAAGRYSVVPGQATAYMVGMLHILEARQRAMDQLGAAFDLREFHRVVLTSGGIPLALLDNVVDSYIADKLANP